VGTKIGTRRKGEGGSTSWRLLDGLSWTLPVFLVTDTDTDPLDDRQSRKEVVSIVQDDPGEEEDMDEDEDVQDEREI
jgi:hypothetical protein